MDGAIEVLGVGEGLVGQMMRFEVVPDNLDVVEFGRVLGSHSTVSQWARAARAAVVALLTWIGPLSSTMTTGFIRMPGLGPIQAIEHLQECNEIGAALGSAGVHNEAAGGVIERSIMATFLACPGDGTRRSAPHSGPGSGKIRMRQGLALVSEEKHDIAGLRLRLSQCQPEAHAVDGVAVLAALQGVTRPAPAELFLRSTLDRRDLEMVTPSRLSISPMRRASVQLCRSATGASSNGVATRSAASALTGAGPGAGLVLSA